MSNQLPDDYVPLNNPTVNAQEVSSGLPDDYVPISKDSSEGNVVMADNPSPPTSSSNPSFLPNYNAVMDKINNRPSIITDLIKDPSTLARFQQHPLGTILRTLGGAMTYAEGVPAAIGLAVQSNDFNKLPSMLSNLAQGKSSPQLGDLIRTTGFGGNFNDTIASTVGGVASLGFTPAVGTEKVVLGQGKNLANYLAGTDIQSRVVPAAEKIFQGNVSKFTPEIQQLAKAQNVNSDIISHIAQRTPAQVEASASAVGNNPGAVSQMLDNGLAQKAKAVNDAYDAAWGAVPKNAYIALPKTQAATTKFLTDNKIIDNLGNLTEYGKQALGDDPSLSKVWQNHLLMGGDSGAGSTVASRADVAPVNQPQWTLLRNNFSRARNSANYESPISNLLDALHEDAGAAGVNVQPARELAAQNFALQDMAKPYTSMTGENRFANIFNLTDKQMMDLNTIDKQLGGNNPLGLVQKAKDIAAAGPQGLGKVRSIGISNGVTDPSFINSLIEKNSSINPLEWKENIKAGNDLEELLGKSSQAKNILNSLNRRKAIVAATEAGIGTLVAKTGIDKFTGK